MSLPQVVPSIGIIHFKINSNFQSLVFHSLHMNTNKYFLPTLCALAMLHTYNVTLFTPIQSTIYSSFAIFEFAYNTRFDNVQSAKKLGIRVVAMHK